MKILLIVTALVTLYMAIRLLFVKKDIEHLKRYIDKLIDDIEKNDGANIQVYDMNDDNNDLINNINALKKAIENKPDAASPQELSTLVEKWEDEDKEASIIKMHKYDVFEDIDEFLNYIHNGNLKIIDVDNERIREICNLEKRIYNGQKTVLISFTTGMKSIFKPGLYAKYSTQ